MPQVTLGRPARYEDLLEVPDHLIAEIVDGELWSSPRPAPRHARAQTSLGSLLVPPYDHGRGGPGGWRILFEPELHLRPDVVVPDLASWRRERMPRLPDTAHLSVAPDWLCEVISPPTALLDRAQEAAHLCREDVRHAWIVDPDAWTLEVFRLERDHWMLVTTFDGSAVVRAEPFELALLWEEPAREAPVPGRDQAR